MARAHRFFTGLPLEKRDFVLGEKAAPEIFFQLVKVLRAKAGDLVTLLSEKTLSAADNASPAADKVSSAADKASSAADKASSAVDKASSARASQEFVFEIYGVQKKEIALRFVQVKRNDNELSFALGLILCLPNKPEKLEFILQKAVELGAGQIILLESDFSQMKHQLRPDRLQKIVKEAAEQSERAVIPQLKTGGKLADFLCARTSVRAPEGRDVRQNQPQLLTAMERSQNSPALSEVLRKIDMETKPEIQVLIGPEGGFSDAEKQLIANPAMQQNLACFSLGKRILRMETAAVVSLGIIALD